MPAPAVTPAELAVLEELWQRGESTVRDLRDAIYPGGGATKLATVQTFLGRLALKKLVKRRETADGITFRAAVEKNAFLGAELRRVAHRLGERSLTPLLTCLVEGSQLSAGEREHLRKLLDEPEARR